MKKLILIAGLLVVSIAQAKEYKVFDVTAGFARASMTSVRFGVNSKLGRSWVEVTVHRGKEDVDDFYRYKVEGLSFDVATESVVMESEGQLVECARQVERGRWIFRKKILELTDRCRFENREVFVTIDNGFEITKQKRLHVYLIVE